VAFVVCSGRFGRLVDVLLDFTSINSIGVRISHRQRNEVAPLPFFNWNPLPVSRLICERLRRAVRHVREVRVSGPQSA